MSKNRPKPAAALYFSGALSATPVGVHQKCRSANTNPDYCWPLFNLKFNIPEDNIAKQYIQEAFPYCKISQIDMTEIAAEGGALHCLTWNIHSH